MVVAHSQVQKLRAQATPSPRARGHQRAQTRRQVLALNQLAYQFSVIHSSIAVIAQLVARRSHNPKVVSSILTHRICDFWRHATLSSSEKKADRSDQLDKLSHSWVEQRTTRLGAIAILGPGLSAAPRS